MRRWGLAILLFLLSVAPVGTRGPEPQVQPGEKLEEFVPSEEIRADSAVSFPVNI
jgi:hypothetical protein